MNEYETRSVAIVRRNAISLVVPGHIVARAGEQVTFQTVDAGRVTLMFPVVLFEQNREDVRHIELGNDDDEPSEATLTVKDLKPGAYPYAVFSHEQSDFAVGGSHPKVIIKR
jgi:hypothetical protein